MSYPGLWTYSADAQYPSAISPRSLYTAVDSASQGIGGNNNRGIIIVQHNYTGKTLIEKRIRPESITHGYVQREIRMMRQVRNHANITHLFGYDLSFQPQGYGSLFLQRGELGSLDALIIRHQHRQLHLPDEGFAWKVLWDMAIGLAYMSTGQDPVTVRQHAMSGLILQKKSDWIPIYHRDIKPSNIFMTWYDPLGMDATPYPTMLIGDFGCALSDIDRPSMGDEPIGDPDFTPPEAPAYSMFTDVYSLALVIVCLGRMVQAPPKNVYPVANHWSAGMQGVLNRMLKTNKYSRPTPGELPMCVWHGYQDWMRMRMSPMAKLPSWALSS